MGKIMALDLGDRWVGSAISDSTKVIAVPYKTIPRNELDHFLQEALRSQPLEAIVIGYPTTMKGGISQQTQAVIAAHQELTQKFPAIPFILWDERLTSKRAEHLAPTKTAAAKQKSHSLAAAFILDAYLLFLSRYHEDQSRPPSKES
jgi:putative holliday junction resolvase